MTASTVAQVFASRTPAGMGGLAALVRKERTEWLRGRRAWTVAIVTTLVMAFLAAVSWLNATLRAAFPSNDPVDPGPISLEPLDNFLGTVGLRLFTFVTIFAVAGLLGRERESGTLAWVASKPVSRSSIWLAKWIAAAVILGIMAGIVPLAVATGIVSGLYGAPDVLVVLAAALGTVATIVFYAAAVLALATVIPSQAGVAGAAIGITLLPSLVSIVPLPLTQLLPESILPWAIGLATGTDVGFVTPVAWLVGTMALVAYGTRRTEHMEL